MRIDPADLEREYSPSSRVGGSSAPFIDDYVARSAVAAGSLGDRLEVLPDGSCHVVAAPGAPLLVFVHGGYWQALSASASTYLATAAVSLGWSFAAIEYTIAPAGTLAAMVDECCAALSALLDRTTAAPSQVVVAGHSAGAHLVAMMALDGRDPRVAGRIDRAVLVSGVFDLRPLVATTVNEPLGLDARAAASLSPMLHLPATGEGRPEVVVAWGDDDTDAFAAQSRHYAMLLAAAGMSVRAFECQGRHHFDVVDDLVDQRTALGSAVLSATE